MGIISFCQGDYFKMKNRIGVWLSLVERYVRDVEVAGSNPVTPIFLCSILPFFYPFPFISEIIHEMLSINLI